ncbi:MAG: PKD domain-containing protein, partial [Anaerolineales bacterium]
MSSAQQAATANIHVNYNGSGWTAEAIAAFEFAAGIWEVLISSPVTIVVDAHFDDLGENILGGAGPYSIFANFDNAPQSDTWYPVATANQLAGVDLEEGFPDIQATFSSTRSDWDFGTGSSTDGNKISFASVVLHELGHGLGFLGSMRVDDGLGQPECTGLVGTYCHSYAGLPMIYDRFTENGAGTALLSFPNNSTDLGDQLTSNDLYFNSPGGNFANGGSRVPIYAPSTWSQGSSYSHLDESYNSTSHALMTYSIAYGETIHNPGTVTLCMFEEMGWTVSESCSASPDTSISGLTAVNDGPTILGAATQLSASIMNGSNVSYEWDFGDSTSGSGAVTSHAYSAPGEYTAEVTATNSVSQLKANTLVQVDEAITDLAADNNGPTPLGNATQLSATIANGSNVSYEWDFGDSTSGSGPILNHVYSAPGSYTAEVVATNSVSQDTATTLVEVHGELQWVYLPLQVNQP